MGFKIQKSEFRVVVEPRHPGDFGFASIGGITQSEEEWIRDCEDIASQIRRHIDGVSRCFVEWDSEKVCEHCGSDWSEPEDSPHNGGCCHKDCEVYEQVEGEI